MVPPPPNPEAFFDSWWPIIIALVIGFGYAYRQYMRGSRCISQIELNGKVALITGGASGIGKYCAIDLSKRGCKVYITARKTEDGEAAVKFISEKSKKENVFFLVCELDKFKSVRDCVASFKKKEEQLDILINNAGVMMCDFQKTEDGFEHQFQVNYLSPFLMTSMLMDSLKLSKSCRIVNVVAAAYQLGEINWDFINNSTQEAYNPGGCYSQSKMALVLFTKAFARKFKDSSILCHCANPGVVNTKIYRYLPFRKSAFVSLSFAPFVWYLMKTPEDGAQTPLYAAVSETAAKHNGEFFKECAVHAYVDNVKDEELQDRLWEESLKWLKLKKFGKEEILEQLTSEKDS